MDRRRLMLLAGTALAAPELVCAAQTNRPVLLDAQGAEGADGRTGTTALLSYRKPAEMPVLRIPQDGMLRVSLKNGLSEPTALDWQGLRIDNAFDIVPGLGGIPLPPGSETTLKFRTTESGTLWFHPPFVPGWSNQTARGLCGVLIVEDPKPPAVDDEVVLMLTDRLDPKGPELIDTLLVNRKAWPLSRTYAPGSRIRLRLVNGSTRQAVSARFEGGRPMVIAIDGQPSELFKPLDNTLPVGPGARFDVLVDMPRDANRDFKLLLGGVDGTTVAALPVFLAHPEGNPKDPYPPIAPLPPNPALPPAIPLEKATRAELTVQTTVGPAAKVAGFTINGSNGTILPKRPLFIAKRRSAVSLGFSNRTKDLIGFRLHGQAMRLLHSLDDGWEPYWRDSILVPPEKTLHAAFQPNIPGRWLIESPFFDQAAAGLRHWFEIT